MGSPLTAHPSVAHLPAVSPARSLTKLYLLPDTSLPSLISMPLAFHLHDFNQDSIHSALFLTLLFSFSFLSTYDKFSICAVSCPPELLLFVILSHSHFKDPLGWVFRHKII